MAVPVPGRPLDPQGVFGRIKQIAEARRNSYRAAMNPRSRVGTPLVGGSGDYHADSLTRRYLRELSRDLDRSSGPCKVILDKHEEFTVGEGVRVRAITADPDWNQRASDLFHQDMLRVDGGIDARQQHSGYALQGLWSRQLATDGDLAVVTLANGRVQTLESEQITGGPTGPLTGYSLHEGLELNQAGAIIRLYGCPFDPNTGQVVPTAAVPLSADDAAFVTLASRSSQTRGVPALHAVLDDFERADSYLESEGIAAELSAQIWVTIAYEKGDFPIPPPLPSSDPALNGQQIAGGLTSDRAPDWQPTTAGSALVAPNGAKATPWNPGRPNRDAEPFVIFLLRGYCSSLGYSYELVFGDLRGMSWSVANQVVGMANQAIKLWQTRRLGPLFSRIYRWRIRSYIARGLLPDRPDWDRHEHEWPRIPPPNEADFFNANLVGLQSGQTSLQRLFGARAFQILTERAQEWEHAATLARALRSNFPEFGITPDHFLGGLQAGSAPPIPAPEPGTGEKTPPADGMQA